MMHKQVENLKEYHMKQVNRYKDLILKHFYLDDKGVVRRATDGYYGRYKKGDIVKTHRLCSRGYQGIHIPSTRSNVPFHHVVLLLNGIEVPDDAVIDHINGNKEDNRLENIRVVTQSINCRNMIKKKSNTTGYTGITFNKASNTYLVRKQIGNKRVYFGQRKTLEEAVKLLDSIQDLLTKEGYTERHGK